ncbi:hypothetical protein CROQUDRAFT_132013 [Cronartium quercuum f. sp. fusiforme G11]|uniref:Uncharacterized protein n=1 Tax=Cronartium quercuum f. sp. fusiforme G11 TaxID=708437 RepID=A0A9P6NRR1_9BASI|nr:hypothetical protein CROQUDRAFT_132013 [Cronartium quercuum f. sp. fusiforme G11]
MLPKVGSAVPNLNYLALLRIPQKFLNQYKIVPGQALTNCASSSSSTWYMFTLLDYIPIPTDLELLAKSAPLANPIPTKEAGVEKSEDERLFGTQFDRINIVIGGSELGPVIVTEDLAHCAGQQHPTISYFCSNINGSHLPEILRKGNPETTLYSVADKTCTTQETITNTTSTKI